MGFIPETPMLRSRYGISISMHASVMSLGKYVVAEAGCNWYLRDINICSLSEKNYVPHVLTFFLK
jgi:hypothetical protein